jgi:hypothetical protein
MELFKRGMEALYTMECPEKRNLILSGLETESMAEKNT